MQDYLGLLETFVVFGLLLGIAILELVCLRLDRKRKQAGDGGAANQP